MNIPSATWVLECRKSYFELYIIIAKHIPPWVWSAILNATESKIRLLVFLSLVIFLQKNVCTVIYTFWAKCCYLVKFCRRKKSRTKEENDENPQVVQTLARCSAGFLLMLLTGLWVLEVNLESCTPTCFHSQHATGLLGALNSSDSFRWLAGDVDRDQTDTKVSATCAAAVMRKILNNTKCRADRLLMERYSQ